MKPIATRPYSWLRSTGRPSPLVIEIFAPVRERRAWGCRLHVSGRPVEFDKIIRGVDAVQALELALVVAGGTLTGLPGEIRLWGKRTRTAEELFLPLPVSSLQGTLAQLREYLRRLKVKGRADKDWRRAMLTLMRETSARLAVIAGNRPNRKT